MYISCRKLTQPCYKYCLRSYDLEKHIIWNLICVKSDSLTASKQKADQPHPSKVKESYIPVYMLLLDSTQCRLLMSILMSIPHASIFTHLQALKLCTPPPNPIMFPDSDYTYIWNEPIAIDYMYLPLQL